MDTHFAQHVKQGFITGAQPVDKSLEKSDVWHWKRWLNPLNFHADIAPLVAQRSLLTIASLSMKLFVTLDHSIAHMLVMNAQL